MSEIIEGIWLRFGTEAAFNWLFNTYGRREEALGGLHAAYMLKPAVRDLVHRVPSEYNALASLVPMVCPEQGEFIAYKKGWSSCAYFHDDYEELYPDAAIITLKIPADAKRSSGFGHKCRASKAQVLQIEQINQKGEFTNYLKHARSLLSSSFVYSVGETVEPLGEEFDEDRFHECAPGIHFFMTKQEAIDY